MAETFAYNLKDVQLRDSISLNVTSVVLCNRLAEHVVLFPCGIRWELRFYVWDLPAIYLTWKVYTSLTCRRFCSIIQVILSHHQTIYDHSPILQNSTHIIFSIFVLCLHKLKSSVRKCKWHYHSNCSLSFKPSFLHFITN